MLQGFRTCLICGNRVLPMADDRCPTCLQYRFTGVPAELAPPVVSAAAKRSEANRLRRGAQLHWRLFVLFPTLIILIILRALASRGGLDGAAAAAGVSPAGLTAALSIAVVVVPIVMWSTAASLTRWLRMVDPRTKQPPVINILRLLKYSMVYFESKNVPVGRFGPRMSALEAEDDAGDDAN